MSSPLERELRRRSPVPSIRAGARWEEHIEGLLAGAGWRLERHPAVPGTAAHPDLLAVASDGPRTRFYVEATATGGGSLVGHRQDTAELRLHDVLMSRLKHKSRALQGVDSPVVVAVLCIAPATTAEVMRGVLDEFLHPMNTRGRNVSCVVLAWSLDVDGTPRRAIVRGHPSALVPLPPSAHAALSALAADGPPCP